MVRFIIANSYSMSRVYSYIYIPIWLDLLFLMLLFPSDFFQNLHSNMVRFIICISEKKAMSNDKFTFQYGQIYYEKKNQQLDLYTKQFTFQYGQIYYFRYFFVFYFLVFIYIPIWLDLLSGATTVSGGVSAFTFQYGQIYYRTRSRQRWYDYLIYIPIWLDLLFLQNLV